MIEACRERLGLVSILSPTRHGDEGHSSTEGALTYLASNFVAIQFRHTDIQKCNFWLHGGKSGQRFFPVAHDRDVMAINPEKRGETLRRVAIVIGNEYPSTHRPR